MQLADALSHCPARASQEIKLDMRVDYIAFTKPWIEKLKDSTQRDPILATVYQVTQQGWPHQRRHVPRLVRRYWDFRDELSLLGPFRTTHSYFDNSVSICPTSVSHYKWTLSKHTSVHAKCKVTIFNCC